MSLAVVVTTSRLESTLLPDWETACGHAVRAALAGAESVRVVDTDGAEYDVWAEPYEPNE